MKGVGADRSGLALIRCDGGGTFGYGHVKRMVALARALREREGIAAVFAVNGTEDACQPARRAGFEAELIHSPLEALVAHRQPELLLLDGSEGPARAELANLSRQVGLSAVIDDCSERRLAAHVAYYPPMPQALALDWSGSDCEQRIGWQWALLGVSTLAAPIAAHSGRLALLVTMGGSDPNELTLRCATALAKLDPMFRARFVVGPGVLDGKRIARRIVDLSRNFETIEGADDLATEYAAADAALAVFGVTAYELAAFGVPALYVCLNHDQAVSAAVFERAGIGLSLGLAAATTDDDIVRNVQQLLHDSQRRRNLRAAGLMTVDDKAATRIAADLARRLALRRSAHKAAS